MSFSTARSAAVSSVRRALRPRGGGGGGSWWGPGHKDAGGHLFGELPPPAGQARAWEDWEAPYYLTMGAAAVILTVGLTAKPDTSLHGWAREEAKRRMQEEEQ
ncbi:unnamed protein product [Closterium sp. Yama58-4]|nr:unnamed protein product [Closterium sp. Yama58-4]